MSKETNKKSKDFTQEELTQFRKTQIDFMKSQIGDLEIQEKYTGLKSKIAENVFNEHLNKVKLAQLKNPPQHSRGEDNQKEE